MLNNYIHDEKVHNTNSASSLFPIISEYVIPASVVDVGCGLGTWLKVFYDKGIKDIIGIDGNYIDTSKLKINPEFFLLHDLSKPINLSRKFDLAICLEVAEHLPEEASDIIINTLTDLSDKILFSAAISYQGGQNHINEKPFSYWVEKFNKKGYIVKDVFRDKIWDNKNIEWWYKQNMFFVLKSDEEQEKINDYYHPENYLGKIIPFYEGEIDSFMQGFFVIKRSLILLFRIPFKMMVLLVQKIK